MPAEKKDIEPTVLKEIIDAIARMKYGEVAITIHDSRIVQIEEKHKKRFN